MLLASVVATGIDLADFHPKELHTTLFISSAVACGVSCVCHVHRLVPAGVSYNLLETQTHPANTLQTSIDLPLELSPLYLSSWRCEWCDS